MRVPFLVLLFLAMPSVYAEDWKPVTPVELSSTPSIDKTADAEVLFWDIRIEQGTSKTVFLHYMRIKIFTDRGVESQGRVDLPYSGRNSIKDIVARTIQPDGTAVELKPNAIFERSIVKGKNVKVQAKSFVLPNVKPGVLIDYRWTEVLQDVNPLYLPLPIQREIPVQSVRLTIKPLSNVFWPLRVTGFNTRPGPSTTDQRGNTLVNFESIPAFQAEPAMPPEAAVRGWLLIYYDYGNFWTDFARYKYESVKSRMRVTDEIRREAAQLVTNGATEEEKLRRLYDFCKKEIQRIDDDSADDTPQRAANPSKENKTPEDTLKRKAGTGEDIDFLFAALANAAGFDVRYVQAGDRERFFFDERYPTPYMLGSYNIAVRINREWRFFDPAGKYLPFGMLRWQEEGIRALLVHPDFPEFASTTSSTAEKSLLKRTFTGRLGPDGTLDGEVRLILFGHPGAEEKESLDGLSASEREEFVKRSAQARIKTAEISDIRIQNIGDPEQPIIESYHVRVPGYAQRIGRRLILEPGYFQHGRRPMLSSNTRIHAVYVPFAWTEDDMVLIDLPEGFALDNADQPAVEAASGGMKHEMRISLMEGGTLRYARRMTFASDKKLLYPVSEYPFIKAVFESVEKRDSHSIAIREGTPEGEKRQ